ncbi:MAG: glycine C-acetyltransferase [Eubacteriaceae bacterium]|jgi:glycine C-acetyltransferase|nr:glycine C-acetyltransferase [Eubacteriaceae bacterium]
MFKTIRGPQGGEINLDGRDVVNMASNNYLGFANDPALVKAAKDAIDEYGVSAGAARHIIGNFLVHNELEKKLAEFKEVEDTCVFSSGLTANTGAIPMIVGKGDEVFSDELNHASIIDGIRLSRAAVRVYRHKDMADLERLLQEPAEGERLIVTDAVFSMDGDLAPIPEIVALGKKYDARVMIDDAHGDGVMGRSGRGTVDHFGVRDGVYVETGSLSKAFGSSGGFVAGPKELIDKIRVQSRSFIFTATPMQPVFAAAALKAIEMLMEDDAPVRKLWDNREYFMGKMSTLGYDLGHTETPVVPVMVGDEALAKEMSEMLYNEGIFAQAIVYPTVAKGKARLRVMISAAHTKKDLDKAVAAFAKVGKEAGVL